MTLGEQRGALQRVLEHVDVFLVSMLGAALEECDQLVRAHAGGGR
jgi:hypothetical protein